MLQIVLMINDLSLFCLVLLLHALQQVLSYWERHFCVWRHTHTYIYSHMPSLALKMQVQKDSLSVSNMYSICLRLSGELLIMDATSDLDQDK